MSTKAKVEGEWQCGYWFTRNLGIGPYALARMALGGRVRTRVISTEGDYLPERIVYAVDDVRACVKERKRMRKAKPGRRPFSMPI